MEKNKSIRIVIVVSVLLISLVGLAGALNKQQGRMGTGSGVPAPKETGTETPDTTVADASQTIDTSGWQTFRSDTFGFSLKAPKEVYSEGQMVPLRVTEDQAARTISLKFDSISGPFGWDIQLATVKDDAELDAFIASASDKAGLGSGCRLGKKEDWPGQQGVLDVRIEGEDWNREGIDLGKTTCSWGVNPQILYSPAKHAMAYVVLGQEARFYGKADDSISYDGDIIGSFHFE